MGNCFKFCRKSYEKESIPILILGLKESGKTEIAYRLMNKKREEFLSTKGCRTFSTKIDKRLIKFTELGGEEFYDIWKYYFLDVMGIIYIIDSSDPYSLERSKEIFGAIMSNDLLTGKPTLIFANKQDQPGALDSLDICDYFEIEYLANLFRTPCYVEGSGQYEETYDSQVARNALNWLLKTINKNYKSIQNKIRFLRVVTQNESLSSNEEIPRKSRRPATGKRKKKLRFSQNRPKTAPNAKVSFSKDNNFLTSSNLASSLRPKKSNQVSPLIGETFSYINYDGACERQIRQGLKGGLINGIITISEMTEKKSTNNLENVIVEDLSLPPTTNMNMKEGVVS
ncbi:hypothetical protein ACKWTF_009594 [Chironomus riparius]